ncbi:MAG TPA: hypothetical protein VHC86_00300 [Opitutaceae bacterium]|nr:hypothetical protein [Opitutaceae bacterium]
MIHSTSSSDRAGGTDAISLNRNQPRAPRPAHQDQDSISTANAAILSDALNNQPEVRPEVVARGRLLAADPNYPPAAVISHIAGLVLNSPDLSEDQS